MDIKDLYLYDLDIKNISINNESTDGNVYNIETNDNKYIAKIYNDLNHALNMISIHQDLYNNNIYVPNIIKTKNNQEYVMQNNQVVVLYSYLEGMQISDIPFSSELVIKIATAVRKLHTINSNYNLEKYIKDSNNKRLSLLHFDLTKGNIFYNDKTKQIGFIDFDDAKYGESLYDVAIIIAFLFVSKKRGFMQDYIKLFIDTYYADDIALKEKELPKIKDYALNWLSELMHTHNFNSSLKDSFENKYKLIKDNDLYGKN